MPRRVIFATFAALCIFVAAEPASALSVDPPVQVGTVTSGTLNEISGLVASRAIAGTLWVHNDSGDSARFFGIGTAGNLLCTYNVGGASADDWEDMAIGPKAGGGNYLYLADIGDNGASRSQVQIYRVTEPLTTAGGTISSAQLSTLQLQYPGGARNAESMIVDPITGDLFIISKEGTAGVFRAPASSFSAAQPVTLTSLGNLGSNVAAATAADISPDGNYILVRGYSTTARLFQRGPGQSVGDALLAPGVAVTIASEPQGETVGWAPDGSGFYTISEGTNSPIYFHAFTVPEPAGIALGIVGIAAVLVFRRPGKRRSCGTV
jgi:hypothetical protein